MHKPCVQFGGQSWGITRRASKSVEQAHQVNEKGFPNPNLEFVQEIDNQRWRELKL
jgi:hypothetical protein